MDVESFNNLNSDLPNSNAVSLYGEETSDFPVLKAFQQYIDAEQAKARKRMMIMAIFFGSLMLLMTAVFVLLLFKMGDRNQQLNDRLVEFAFKEREREHQSQIVVQPAQQENALAAVAKQMSEMQKSLLEQQKKALEAEQAAKEAARKAAEVAKENEPTAEEKEIARLKALLATEQEKVKQEKAKQKELELEEYRRKHYPELYAPVVKRPVVRKRPIRPIIEDDELDEDEDIADDGLDDNKAISYFDEEDDDEDKSTVCPKKQKKAKAKTAPVKKEEQPETPSPQTPKESYSIPVDVQGRTSSWSIPE